MFGQPGNSPFGSPPATGFGQAPAPFGQSPAPAFGQSPAPAFGGAAGGFGQSPAPAFGAPAPSTGFGGTSAFGSSTTTFGGGGGGFGAAPAPSTGFGSTGGFGSTTNASPFGAPAAAPSTGLFGGSTGAPSTGLFGASNTTNTGFGAAPATSAFGSTTSTFGAAPSTGGFGAQSTFGAAPAPSTGGLFGAPAAAPSFGSPAPAFGSTPAFGQPAAAPTGLFGAAPAPSPGGLFGAAPGVAGQPGGGTKATPFQPTNRQDGTSTITMNSITAMGQYENKSFEELRFEDYSQGNKGSANAAPSSGFGGFGASAAPTPGLFGGSAPAPAFGAAPASTPFGSPAPAPFGAPAPAPFGSPAPAPFGSPAPAPFGGAPSSGFGGFGGAPAPPPGGSLFGSPPAPGGGLFGSAPTPGTFGAPGPAPSSAFGFGSTPAPASGGGLFGSAPAPGSGLFGSNPAPAFGSQAPAPGSLFGSTPAPAPGSLFGGAPAPGSGLFGSTPALGAFGSPVPSSGFGGFGAPAPAPGSFFGQPTQAQSFTSPPGGGLFGSPAPQAATPALPPAGSIIPQAASEVLSHQIQALENKRKEMQKLDVWRGKSLEDSRTVPATLSQYDSGMGGIGMNNSNYSSPYRPSPKSTAKIRPRGFGSILSPSPTTSTSPLNDIGSGGRLMMSPDAYAASSVKRLVIRPDSLTPKPKIRLRLASSPANDSEKNRALPVDTTSPSVGGQGESSQGPSQSPMLSPTAKASIPVFGSGASPSTTTPVSPRLQMNGGKTVASLEKIAHPPDPGFEYYQKVVGSPDGVPPPSPSPAREAEAKATSGSKKRPSYLPKLTKPGYIVSPSPDELALMSEADLATLTGFSIRHDPYGMVEWEGAVDVRNADLDRSIVIGQNDVSVYTLDEEEGRKPPIGSKLNRPAVITFFHVFPKNGGANADEETKLKFAKRIEKSTSKMEAELISYNKDNGEWAIRVQHF